MDARLHSLPLFHRVAGKAVVVVGDGETAEAKRRLIARAGGRCCPEDEAGEAQLAFVAMGDRASAEAAATRLRALGLLVNVADQPDLCDFTLPSVLERGDVLVAVSTGGASAGLAKHLRLRLEAILPASLALLASSLATAREAMRQRWPDPAQRRHALDLALSERGPLDPLDSSAPERLSAWLEREIAPANDGVVEIVIRSDDPDELTLRQARLLGIADTIVHPPDIPSVLLARARADAVLLHDDTDSDRPGLTVKIRRGA